MSRDIDPAHWRQIEPIIDAALEMSADERAAYLDEACRDDAALRAMIESLITADVDAGEFLEAPVDEFAATLMRSFDAAGLDELEPDARVGPYRVVRAIGRGGMGAVYLADRDDGQFDQRVALKLVRRGMDTGETVDRFLRERQILARLEHPNIARLLDGGVTREGRPFFAMEYVEGEPITKYCDTLRLGVDTRLRLFVQVCDAVGYAHQNLVVHRDLKPSNTLVTTNGGVKLLDFGIAKLLDDDAAGEAGLTRFGLRPMTPDYAAPEQVRGGRVTTATDVYALGAMLYELLSGRRPYRLSSRTAAEVERLVCEIEPPPPSVAVKKPPEQGRPTKTGNSRDTATSPKAPLTSARTARGAGPMTGESASLDADAEMVAAARSTRADRLTRQLRGDLDTIVLTALQKEPGRRYASVEALRSDVARHLRGLPIWARRDTVGYRAVKFARRHAVGLAAAALVLLSLTGGLIGTAWQARVASREAAKAQEVRDFVLSLFELSDPDRSNGRDITALALLEHGARRVQDELHTQPAVRAELLGVLGEIHRKLGLLNEAEPLLTEALDLKSQTYGARSGEVADALHALAELRIDQGRHADAEGLYRQALEIRQHTIGRDDPASARSLAGLGSVLTTLGRFDEAEQAIRAALDLDRNAYGDEHETVADDLETLATLLRARGDRPGAIDAARQTLELRLRTLGEDHLETATARNNLAILLAESGDLDEAEALYREVLDFDIRRVGRVHPYTATVMNNLASLLRRKGELTEAESLYRQVLELDYQLFGDEHPYIATVMNNLGTVLRDEGSLDEAEHLFRGALDMFRRVYGEENPAVGTAHAALASTLHLRGEDAASDSLFVEAIERLEATLPAGHPRTAAALLGRGRLLLDMGRAAEAESLVANAARMREAAFGADDSATLEARVLHGRALAALGRSAEGAAMIEAAREKLRALPYAQRQLREADNALVRIAAGGGTR